MLVGQWDVLRTESMSPTLLETGVLHRAEDVFCGGRFPHISSVDLEYRDVND
jgi:hypothetical protein